MVGTLTGDDSQEAGGLPEKGAPVKTRRLGRGGQGSPAAQALRTGRGIFSCNGARLAQEAVRLWERVLPAPQGLPSSFCTPRITDPSALSMLGSDTPIYSPDTLATVPQTGNPLGGNVVC